MTVLADVLDSQQEEERQRAARALLRHPLLTPARPDPALFALVRRHAAWLADWFAREAGWSLQMDSGVARLRKTPAGHDDGTRGAAVKTRFSRRRYVLTCLALAVLERAESQITLGRLAERILRLATDPQLTEAGVTFTLESAEERSDLVTVARLLLEIGVLAQVAGDEQAFVAGSGDALYDVDRRVLSALLIARRGPSTVAGAGFADRLRAITEDVQPDTEDGRNRVLRHAVTRRLLDDPVVYYADLTEEERTYLDRQRGPLLRRIQQATGLVPEVRAEGIALVDPTGEATDLAMPEEGTDGHATLLVAEYLAAAPAEGRPVPLDELHRHLAAMAQRHRTHWRKTAAEPGAERELTARALHRLTALGLVRMSGEQVTALPAIARYRYAEPTIVGKKDA
ncbi:MULTISPECIES: TIGR02678 family protein [Thermomonospora]|uniref:TIGR02678 family protein n=1 Tax=Thermomonospora curvata (strain ATCC 19995 / DSM 43183 / JCM 3096 / KCTC 9072 / NBRC 15933 / NCIMB 10081 / Henssen B9) TaxID=471852 RepID=D1AAR1_THECD|nr:MULTISPECIES: TIGR02678 family protein [Thermomonospora]ACY97071.1 conserved hypothetical protein [Thermomonospora curvata DSM 43183]